MKRLSGFICGVLVTVLVMGLTVPGFAALTAKTIEVYTGVNLYVDDVKFTPRDANGKEVEVLLYNGTTYLPVRAIGEAYGKAIAWDGSTKSAYIGDHAAKPALADGVYVVFFPEKPNADGSVTVKLAKYVGLTRNEVNALVPGVSVLDFSKYADGFGSPITVRSVDYSADGTQMYINHTDAWLYWSDRNQMWVLMDEAGAGIAYADSAEYILSVASGAKLIDWSMAVEKRYSTIGELLSSTWSYNNLSSITVKNGEITAAEIYYHP